MNRYKEKLNQTDLQKQLAESPTLQTETVIWGGGAVKRTTTGNL